MRRRLTLLVLTCMIALAGRASATSIVLDPMLEALDANPCLPLSQQHVVFLGPYCDGLACPPDPLVANCPGSGLAAQFGLTSIVQDGAQSVLRQTRIEQSQTWTGSASAQIRPARARFEVATTDPAGGSATLRYGSATWHLNLAVLGALELRVPLEGDITPSRPLSCFVQMIDRSSPSRFATLTIEATGPGVVVLPLGAFFAFGGFDFASVDDIDIALLDCEFGTCAQPVPARSYSVGPITLETVGTTAATPASWGRLKALYR